MAPVAAPIPRKSPGSTKSASARPSPQSIESPGPAMNPSRDMHLFTTTFPLMLLIMTWSGLAGEGLRHCAQTRDPPGAAFLSGRGDSDEFSRPGRSEGCPAVTTEGIEHAQGCRLRAAVPRRGGRDSRLVHPRVGREDGRPPG